MSVTVDKPLDSDASRPRARLWAGAMNAAADEPRDANLAAILGESFAEPIWLRRVDAIATRIGDSINPILIKETRQALKSRQFVVTFSLLLFAAIAWTIAGSSV